MIRSSIQRSASGIRHLVPLLGVFLVLFSSLALAGERKGQPMTILFFNDLEAGWDSTAEGAGGLGGLARLAGVVKRIKAENEKQGIPTLVFASGDVFTGGSLAFLFQGEAEVDALNAMGVDAMVAGDHFLGYGEKQLVRLRDRATFPLLASDILLSSLQVNPLEPYVVRNWGGRQVAILGFSSGSVLTGKSEIVVTDPFREAEKLLPRLRGRAELVIGLSHEDFTTNLALAERSKGMDILVGGLSFPRSEAPRQVGRCLVSQGYTRGIILQRLDFVLEKDRIGHAVNQVIPIERDIPPDSAVVRALSGYESRSREAGKVRVAEGKKKLPALGPSEVPWETDLGNLVADAMRERLGLPIALVNSSAIRSGLPFGPVTVADVFQAISPRTRLAALELKGSTLTEILETSVSSQCPDFLQASGLSVDVGLGRVVGLRAGGDTIVPDRWYAVATTDSAVVKSCYDPFKKGRDYQSYDLSLAQVVLDYIRERNTIGTETEIRFRVRTK